MASYHGGKKRIGKELANIIVDKTIDIIEKDNKSWNLKGYCEPFCGMLGVYQHIPKLFEDEGLKLKYKSGDTNKSVIMMWNEAKKGWKPPTNITEKRYNKLKFSSPSPEKGYVGHQYSFGSQFFKGYAPKYGKKSNFLNVALNVSNIGKLMNDYNVVFKDESYTQYSNLKNYVIYCDPPYIGTEQRYKNSFDSNSFYNWCRKMSEDNIIFISEYKVPQDFKEIWSKNTKVTGKTISKKYGKGNSSNRCEKLFLL